MDTNTIKTEIRQVLEAINEQWEILDQHQGRIPQIEIDIILGNIRELYEAFSDLNRKNEVPVVAGTEVRESPVIEIIPHPVTVAQPEPQQVTPARAPSPAAIPEPALDPVPAHARPVSQDPDLFSGPEISATVGDRLKEEKTTLNERLQQEKGTSTLGEKLTQHAIRDLKSAIGINEKFQFINHLFNGSMQDYTQAVAELNEITSLDDAIAHVDTLKFKYNWDTNSDAYHKMMDFIRRRFL